MSPYWITVQRHIIIQPKFRKSSNVFFTWSVCQNIFSTSVGQRDKNHLQKRYINNSFAKKKIGLVFELILSAVFAGIMNGMEYL